MNAEIGGIACYGCGGAVGAKGTAPAEVIRLSGGTELRIHRTHDCRTRALRRWMEERNR